MLDFKGQFRVSNFGLSKFYPEEFVTPLNDCCHSKVLLIIRGVFAIYTVVAMIADVIRQSIHEQSGRWFIYFTSWNYMIVVTYFVTAFIHSVKSYNNNNAKNIVVSNDVLFNKSGSASSVSTLHTMDGTTTLTSSVTTPSSSDRFLWIVYNIAITICPFVVLGYWFLIFDPNEILLRANARIFFSIDRHGIIFILLLIEFFFQRNPYRILHFYFPCLVWIFYVIFNASYWAVTGDGVYSTVNWSGAPGRTVAAAALMVVVIAVYHFLFYFVDVLKKSCFLKRNPGNKVETLA